MQGDGMCILLAVLLVTVLLSTGMRDMLPPLMQKRSCGCASGVCGAPESGSVNGIGPVASARVGTAKNTNPTDATAWNSAPAWTEGTPTPKPSGSQPKPIPAYKSTEKDSAMTKETRKSNFVHAGRVGQSMTMQHDLNPHTKIGTRGGMLQVVNETVREYTDKPEVKKDPTGCWFHQPGTLPASLM